MKLNGNTLSKLQYQISERIKILELIADNAEKLNSILICPRLTPRQERVLNLLIEKYQLNLQFYIHKANVGRC